MYRLSRSLLTGLVFLGLVVSAWAGCYPPYCAPASPVVPVCPPPVVPQTLCCKPIPLLPPAPQVVAPIIVPYMPVACPPTSAACYPVPLPCWQPAPISKVRPGRGLR